MNVFGLRLPLSGAIAVCFAIASLLPSPLSAETASAAARPPMPLITPAPSIVAPITLRVIGSHGMFSQYDRLEAPFWQEVLPRETGGRLRAEATAYDRAGIRGEDLLRLVQLGIAAVATLPLALIAGDEPEFSAPDLPLMQETIGDLQRSVSSWRSHLATQLREQHRVELLAIYTYPAQLLFCREPFRALSDIAGRKIRSSGAGQTDLLTALKTTPVVLAFSDIREGFRTGQIGCAITGGLPGLETGLQAESHYLYTRPLGWNLNAMVMSLTALKNLPPDLAAALRDGVGQLEGELWQAASEASQSALECAAGKAACPGGTPRGAMSLVEEKPSDRAVNQALIREVVVPSWARRCGESCRRPWNETIGAERGLLYPTAVD